MPKTVNANVQQLSLDDLLDQHPGEFVNYEVVASDIGGELLPLLSKGLYTNPLHCVREYVQNAVDAGAIEIRIKITGNSVVIYDDGCGMNSDELVQARRFGVSPKDMRYSVGFRGVGIYSGYDLCNRLLITSKKQGERYAYILEFDFGAMKRQLADDAKSGSKHISLEELIQTNSRFSKELQEESLHYTTVQLEDISDVHIKQLADRAELRNYILRNLPIDFDESFPYRDEINTRLRDEVPGFKAVKVVLESDGIPREVVAKPGIEYLGRPIMNPIANARGEKIAFYWACLRETPPGLARGRIPDQYADYRGFIYKVKGFTIGDNTKLRSIFTKGNSNLYDWYTGEIYVVDPGVIPNTERYDFETNAAKQTLEKRVFDALKGLETRASDFQMQGRAMDKFTERVAEIEKLEIAVNQGVYDQLDTYSKLSNIIDELDNQKGKLPDDQKLWGQEVLRRAKELKRLVSGEIDNPQTPQKKRREHSKLRQTKGEETFEEVPEQTNLTKSESGGQLDETLWSAKQEEAKSGGLAGVSEPTPVIQPLRSLTQVIEEAGWSLSEDCIRIVDIIDHTLADVLISGSKHHQAVLSDVETKLLAALAE